MASRSYRKIVAQYHRDYPYQVAVINGDDWRDEYLGRQHYAVTQGPLVLWFEEGRRTYGFKTAEQAAAFRQWIDTCGIDWSKGSRDGPRPAIPAPPERPPVPHFDLSPRKS